MRNCAPWRKREGAGGFDGGGGGSGGEGSIYTKASGGQGASVSDLASGNALEDGPCPPRGGASVLPVNVVIALEHRCTHPICPPFLITPTSERSQKDSRGH